MRRNYNEENLKYGIESQSYSAPLITKELYIPIEIFKKSFPQTETEQRINRGYKIDKKSYMKKYQKIRNCYNELRKLIKNEDIKIKNEEILKSIKEYIKDVPDWEKNNRIIRSDYNIGSAFLYTYVKDLENPIPKKQFLDYYKIEEKHLNKVLQAKSVITNKFRRKKLGYDNGTKNQFSKSDDGTYDVVFVPAIDLDENNNRIYNKKQIQLDRKTYTSENPFFGFMICIFYLKFIQECEIAHYEYLVKNKSLYKSGAFFIEYEISKFSNQIDFSDKFQQDGDIEKFQKIVDQLVVQLIEECIEFIYEHDEESNIYSKSQERSVQNLPINFIQLITESGFTPPVCV